MTTWTGQTKQTSSYSNVAEKSSTYLNVPDQITDNLVGYWAMEGASTDSSGNSQTGTDTAITYSTANGKILQGAGFNGTTSTIALPSGFPNLTTDWTYSFWIKRNSTAQGVMYSRWTNSGAGRQILIYFNADGTIGIDVPFVGTPLTTTTAFNDTTAFHNYVFTRKGNVWSLYYDGVLDIASTSATTQENSSTTPRFGRNTPADRFLSGAMDEIGIWSVALTQNNITFLYNAGTGKTYPLL